MKKYERTLRLSFNFLRDYLCGKKNQYSKKSVQISLISVICVPLFVMNPPPPVGGIPPPLTATHRHTSKNTNMRSNVRPAMPFGRGLGVKTLFICMNEVVFSWQAKAIHLPIF